MPQKKKENISLLANSEKASNIFIVCLLICSLKEAQESVNQKNFHLKKLLWQPVACNLRLSD